MSKKKFDTSDLLNGLTGGTQSGQFSNDTDSRPSTPQRSDNGGLRRGRKPMSAEEERISTIVNSEKYAKIKTIAHIENLPIKDVVDKGFDLTIEAYEAKHGPVRIKKNRKKGDINDIF